MESRFRLRIGADRDLALGPGKVALLEAIEETGSISAAGRKLGMSYRRAWLLVDSLNRIFGAPVVMTQAGGRAGGGAELTEFGREIVSRYRAMEREARQALDDHMRAFESARALKAPLPRRQKKG